MIPSNQADRFTGTYFDRPGFTRLSEAALTAHSYRFARQAALNWLAVYPGDLGMNLLLAKALLGDGKEQQALSILEKLCRLDPEFAAAWSALAQAQQKCHSGDPATSWANVRALGEKVPALGVTPEWTGVLQAALAATGQRQVAEAEPWVHQALSAAPDSTLAAVAHLQLTVLQGDQELVVHLAELYHARWPECLQFALHLAAARIQLQDDTEAVRLLHHCVANDASGQAPERLWGKDHRFRALWPESLEVEFDQPIPAEVAGLLGWNQLPSAYVPEPEEPEAPVEAEPEQPPAAVEAADTGPVAAPETTLEAIGLAPQGEEVGATAAAEEPKPVEKYAPEPQPRSEGRPSNRAERRRGAGQGCLAAAGERGVRASGEEDEAARHRPHRFTLPDVCNLQHARRTDEAVWYADRTGHRERDEGAV